MKRIVFLIVALVGCVAGRAQTVQQTFNLQAGWNSIWLEVTPANTAVETVFGGLPLDAVWTYSQRLTSAAYIQDINEPVWNVDRWLLHVPTNRVESVNNNLFAIFGQRAYLVKLTAPATLTVTGRPTAQEVAWVPDAFNLRGYPIDPAAPPTFNNFFRLSSAHFNTVSNRLERIYRLNSAGSWVLAGPGELMQSGVAYWTYCRGGSDFQAPFQLSYEGIDGLDFGANLDEITLRLRNRATTNIQATLLDRSSPTIVAYGRFNAINGNDWVELPPVLAATVAGGQSQPLRLAVRRGAMSGDAYGSVLEFRNGAGVRWQLPITARRAAPPAGPGVYAGLWAGNLAIDRVNEVNHATDPNTPTPVSAAFNQRLLLHVDAAGTTRLLREVVQLWKDGASTNNADGRAVVAAPGRYVLVTDERLIPDFTGGTLRDGQLVGRRLSSAFFDFPTTPDANFLRLGGSFGGSATLSGSISLAPTFARNPFLHRYHPDHDNLDVDFRTTKVEAYPVTRSFEFRFSTTNVTTLASPDYGHRVVSGTFRETVSGLNKRDIVATGTFRLTRVSDIGVLNQ